MMVSDFIAMIGRLMHLNITALIGVAIVGTILGAITHKVVGGIQSAVVLTVASLVALLIWVHLWETEQAFWAMIFTINIAVMGYELYRRLIGRYG